MIIQYKNLDELKLGEKGIVRQVTEKYAARIERSFPQEDATLVVHIKDYSPLGERIKYSVHVRVTKISGLSAQAVGWDLHKATRLAFEKLQKEIEHRFRK